MVEERNTNQTSASGERSRSGGVDSECGTNSMMKFAGPALVSDVRFLRSRLGKVLREYSEACSCSWFCFGILELAVTLVVFEKSTRMNPTIRNNSAASFVCFSSCGFRFHSPVYIPHHRYLSGFDGLRWNGAKEGWIGEKRFLRNHSEYDLFHANHRLKIIWTLVHRKGSHVAKAWIGQQTDTTQ